MKHFKMTPARACLLALLVCAFGLRVLLAWMQWPLLNSDEGTMGIMAMHIQHGERPIFFYGQNYMGTLEAYIAAPIFQFLGTSVLTLRLGLILLFVLFLVCMYLLTRQLYSKGFALFILLLLSLGSSPVFSRQLIALGGYAETLLFTVVLFLLAYWLALSPEHDDRARQPQATRSSTRQPQGIAATRRFPRQPQEIAVPPLGVATRVWLGYTSWGFVLGLALWSDALILPWAICSGIVLLLFCWRELLKGKLFALLSGLLLGALPLIIYNIGAAPGQDSWSVLIGQQGGVPFTLHTILQQLQGTLTVSIPTITGSPFCHMDELADIKILGFAPSQPTTLHCNLLGGTWSLLYLGLLLLSMAMTLDMLRKDLRHPHIQEKQANIVPDNPTSSNNEGYLPTPAYALKRRTDIVRHVLACSLFAAALLTLLIYMHSHSPIDEPAEYSRYLICLWVVTPLTLWPLWSAATSPLHPLEVPIHCAQPQKGAMRIDKVVASAGPWLCRGLLLLLIAILCYGTCETLSEIPLAQAAVNQETLLIAGLTRHNITHIYTDYWTCDRLAFASQEQIICGVLAGGCTLQRGLHNRYAAYYTTVSRDPRTAYVILTSTHCDTAVAQKMKSKGQTYTIFPLNNYTVYQPG